MSATLNHLQDYEKAAVDDCVLRLCEALSHEQVVGIWLFGSKARGDYGPDSDIDMLVVLRTIEPEERWRSGQVSARCSLEYDVLINTHIVSEERWNEEVRYQGTLWREVQRDGVWLLPEAAQADA